MAIGRPGLRVRLITAVFPLGRRAADGVGPACSAAMRRQAVPTLFRGQDARAISANTPLAQPVCNRCEAGGFHALADVRVFGRHCGVSGVLWVVRFLWLQASTSKGSSRRRADSTACASVRPAWGVGRTRWALSRASDGRSVGLEAGLAGGVGCLRGRKTGSDDPSVAR